VDDKALRRHLVNLLQGRGAHMPFEDAVADFPPDMINTRPPNVSYTPWHLIEHLRIAQWDILEYVRNPEHESPPWPEGYWPAPDAQTDVAGWNVSIEMFQRDLRDMQAIVEDPANDLLAPISHGYDGHTIMREALILADHNAYHVGELAILRQVMGAWGTSHR